MIHYYDSTYRYISGCDDGISNVGKIRKTDDILILNMICSFLVQIASWHVIVPVEIWATH